MIAPSDIAKMLSINPCVSEEMKNNIELWELMYKNISPWVDNEKVKSLGLASMIASEKARTATLEMDVKITGESVRAKYLKAQFEKVLSTIRTQLEFGIALGGLVVKPYVVMGPDGNYKIDISYTKADHFYPMSFSPSGDITEAAFVDRILTKDVIYSKLEYHKLVDGNKVVVTNTAYKKDTAGGVYTLNDTELGTPIELSEVSAWSALAPTVTIDHTDKLLFAYFKMPQANHIDLDSPLGVSGFSRAIDLIQDADRQYSNLLWEFEGGQLAVDVDRTAFNVYKGKNGEDRYVLPKLQDRLFRRTLDLNDDFAYNVFSPTLRDNSIINGLDNILMHIEDVCDMSRGSLSMVKYTEARTATELKIQKQRSYAANCDVQKELQRVLDCTLQIMDKYCDLYHIVEKGTYEVSYSWDDSIIIDKDAERQLDLIDVQNGLMSKVEYRMKWFGETENQAKQAVEVINEERKVDIEIESKPSDEQTVLERSSQSNKTTEKI